MMMNCAVALSTAAGCDFLPSHYLPHFLSTFLIIIFIYFFDLPDTANPQKIFLFYFIYFLFTACLFIVYLFHFLFFFIDLVGEMIENPFETKSDSFYFVNGSLINVNRIVQFCKKYNFFLKKLKKSFYILSIFTECDLPTL